MAGEIRLDGLAEILANLRALPEELVARGGGPVRKALSEAAAIVRDDAQVRAPVDTGLLRREIRMMRVSNPARLGASEVYLVGVRKGRRKKYADTRENRRKRRVGKRYEAPGRAYYWRFLEFGTEKLAARPFLRPAFDARKEQAALHFRDALRDGVAKIVARMRKGRQK